MIKKVLILCLISFSLLPLSHSLAFETKGQDCSRCHTLTQGEARDLLKTVAPDIKVLDIRLSPSKPLWEVFSESGGKKMLLYIDLSKKYIFYGSIISLKDKRNLTQESFIALNKVDVTKIPLNDALVLGDAKAKLRVIVFTDPD
jgi:thiol:disulfide interchange protein DsbC